MKVKDLIKMLEQCDQEAFVITNSFINGVHESTLIRVYEEIGGVDNRLSYEKIKAIEILKGNALHMSGQGITIITAECQNERKATH